MRVKANEPKAIGRMKPSDIVRFLRKVKVVGGHWLWQRCKDRDGYGQFWVGGRAHWAHRLSYATFVGPIPDGLTVHHKEECLTPGCVCPDHLELLTIGENSAEANRRRFSEEPVPF